MSKKPTKKRVLREDIPAKLLKAFTEAVDKYGNARGFSKRVGVPYQNIYVMKTTGRGTPKDIQKISKALQIAA